MLKLFPKHKRKLPIILQDETAECGHACVAMISNYFGHDLDLLSLRAIKGTTNRGVTLLDISQLFEQLGLVTRAIKVSLNELHLITCPAILHWNMNHFVVLKAVKKNKVIIHDPAIGLRSCTFEEVSQSYTGIVLEVAQDISFHKIHSQHQLTLFELLKNIHGMQRLLGLLLMLAMTIELLNLISPLFLQYVTDKVIAFAEYSNLYTIALGFLLISLLQQLADYWRGHLVIFATNHLNEQFAANLMRHLLKLPLSFFEKRHKGDLQSKFQAIDRIQEKISTDFVNAALDSLLIIVNFLVMICYSGFLTSIVILSLIVCFFIRYASFQAFKRQKEASIRQHAKAATVFLETLQSILPIKTFLKERIRFNTWRNTYVDSLNADIVVAKMNLRFQLVEQLLCHLEHVLVVCLGAGLVANHQLSTGMLLAFLAYRTLLVGKASSLIEHIIDYKLIAIQLQRLGDILFQAPEPIIERSFQPFDYKGALEVSNLCFRYESGDRPILDNLSFTIAPGEKIAVIGPSGCGKSTLVKVLMGLLPYDSGHILLDGVSVNLLGLSNYRQMIAAVMQDDCLLSGSIANNITFFDEQFDIYRLHQAAKHACIEELINSLPMGYETLVGDMGSTLSGGQRQRILLARALYKKPKILFLDEATSHLDLENEAKINQALRALNMTQIIIAHRPETIRMADKIIDLGQFFSIAAS
ncbi:MAG: peptidase domain-containing ABC transporter [Legionella sp.]